MGLASAEAIAARISDTCSQCGPAASVWKAARATSSSRAPNLFRNMRLYVSLYSI